MTVMRPVAHADSVLTEWGYLGVPDCRDTSAPQQGLTGGTVGYTTGLEPQPRGLLPGYDSGVATVLLLCLVLVGVALRHYPDYFKQFGLRLAGSAKSRANAFDDTTDTAAETYVTVSLLTVTCLCEGILVYLTLPWQGRLGGIFASTAICTGAAALFMVARGLAYGVAGWVFADGHKTAAWLRGFRAGQALLGVLLLAPALWTLYSPGAASYMATAAAMMYLAVLGLFLIKWFRIFYDGMFSYVGFILYLCTLEIAPLALLYRLFV